MNNAESLLDSVDILSDLQSYIHSKQSLVTQMLDNAFKADQIDELTYHRLSASEFTGGTFAESFDHFSAVLSEMVEIGQNHRLSRIVKGAEYLESITADHPKWAAANERYDKLVEDYRKLRRRLDGTLETHDGA